MSPSLLDKINRFRPVSWALVSFLSACTGPLTEDDTPPGDDDPAEDGWIRSEPEFCSSPQVEADNEDPTLWETTHYRLHLPGVPAEEATEIARLAERAFPAFAAFFGAEPSSLPLEAWLDLDAAAFQARLAEHGIPGVPEAGGWFEPGVGAFLFTQPTAYYTRVLFLHELTHQFHHATSVQGAFPFWYSEGLAEALARHHQDGDCLTLRVTPLLSWEDPSASPDLDPPPSCVECLIGDASFQSRPLAMEIVRFLASSPAHRDAFVDWRGEVDQGVFSASDPAPWLERWGPIAEDLAAFLPLDQEPMAPLWLDWIPEGPDQLSGWSDASSAARVKGPISSFHTSARWNGEGEVGVIVGHDSDTGDVELALVNELGSVSRFAVLAGEVSWVVHGQVGILSVDPEGRVEAPISVSMGEGTALVTVGGTEVTVPRVLEPAGGVALYASSARFTEIGWAP